MFYKLVSIYKDSFSGLSRNVWLLGLVMLINRAGAMVLTFLSLYLTTSLGFSLSDAGWILGAYGVGSICGALLGGYLADTIGFYYVQVYSLVLGAVLLLLLIFLTNYWAILATVFCFATISDTMRPANSVAVAVYAKPENRTRSFSLMRFAVNLGFSIGPALGGVIAGTTGFKWIFLVDAVTCLFAAALLVKYLPFVKPEKPGLESDLKTEPIQKGPSAYQDREYILFTVLVALYAIAFFQLFTSVPVYWEQEWGFSTTKIGALLALNGFIIVLIEMPFVRALEDYKRFMIIISLGSAMLIGSFVSLLLGWTSIIPALIFITLMSLSEMFAMPFMTNYAMSRPTEDRRGQYMGLYTMAYGVAHVVAPAGSLYIAEHLGFNSLYSILIGISILVTISFYSLRKRRV
jgi:predicted MFS family arabinose efflux permease